MDVNTTTQTGDSKIQRDHHLEVTNVEQIKAYFQRKKPDHEVTVRPWTVNSDCRRFYFGKNNEYEHILDVRRSVLQDLTHDKIIDGLEAAKWEQELKSHPRQVVCFSGNALTFGDWPH